MILGLCYGGTQADDTAPREKTFQVVGEFIKQFKERNGVLTCMELLGYDLSDPRQAAEAREHKAMAPRCPKLIRDASEILETLL